MLSSFGGRFSEALHLCQPFCLTDPSFFHIFINNEIINRGGEPMKMERFVYYFLVVCAVIALIGTNIIAEDKPSSQSDISEPTASSQAAPPSSIFV
jgi:hypothetical protein